MRLCLASSITDDSSISEDSTVSEATLAIAKKLKVSESSVFIVYKGKVLREGHILKDYGSV